MTTNTKIEDRTNQILAAIFGEGGDLIDEQFSVFENRKENMGKLYLPLHICLKSLKTLPFEVEGDVHANKVVLRY